MTRGWSRTIALCIAVLLALPLAGCGDGTTGPDLDKEPVFNGMLEGGDLARLDGIAAFRVETYNAGNDRGFTLRLMDEDVSGELVLRTLTPDLPTVGDHEIVPTADREDSTELRGVLRYVAGGVLQEFEIRSGRLHVTAARATQLEGTVELRARRKLDAQGVYLTATFVARPYDELTAQSSHALTVAGAVAQTLSGETYYGQVFGAGGSIAWGMVFRQTPMQGALSLGRIDAVQRPAVGTYRVSGTAGAGVQFQGGYIVAGDAGPLGVFTLTGGTVTITESSGTRLRGTVDLVASGTLTSEPEVRRELTIRGSFDGRPGDIIAPPMTAD